MSNSGSVAYIVCNTANQKYSIFFSFEEAENYALSITDNTVIIFKGYSEETVLYPRVAEKNA